VVELLGTAGLEVGATATVDEQGVAAEQVTLAVDLSR
jgi:hypothetical protein